MKCWVLGLYIAVAAACGGTHGAPTPAAPAAARAYAATRWFPARPTYALAARTLRDAQRGLVDFIDVLGMLGDVSVASVSEELRQILLVDPLSPDAVSQIGVDLDGGFAVFSDKLNPTFVVHLASPAAFQAFLERQTDLTRQSVVVDGVEVFTALLPGRLRISWAVATDWLWIHFALPFAPDDGTAWFTARAAPRPPAWSADWAWATASAGGGGLAGEPPVVGFVDPRGFLADLASRAPSAAACVGLLDLSAVGVGRIAVALEGDRDHLAGRIAVDVGPASATIERALLPSPEGFRAATAQVPIALQWNLDLAAVRSAIAPCAQAFGFDRLLHRFDELGVRAGRGFLRSFDGDSGSGALALDLSHEKFFADQLDRVPMRSALERKRQFGPYAGRSLAIPMFLTIDYVLTDAMLLAGVGDGLLVSLVGAGGSTKGPVFEAALQPLGLSLESWEQLLDLAEVGPAGRVAERLRKWREVRVALTVDGTRLVLSASGSRR